jgi:hypothetical protein
MPIYLTGVDVVFYKVQYLFPTMIKVSNKGYFILTLSSKIMLKNILSVCGNIVFQVDYKNNDKARLIDF